VPAFRAGRAESLEGVDDAPNGAEEADEGRDGAGGGEPGHAFFGAAIIFAVIGAAILLLVGATYRENAIAAQPPATNVRAALSSLAGNRAFATLMAAMMAMIVATTRVVLPYDEAMTGMSRAQLASLNPRLLSFMRHDRVSLAGTMLSVGIFYAFLAWFGIRHGSHWAHVTVIVSAAVGFLTFFLFLGFGYFDPFHAFVTAILTQFTLLLMTMQPSPAQPSQPEWRETSAWRRGQWGQLLFILIGAGLSAGGLVISLIGCTSVFVHTDLEFMRITAAQLRVLNERVLPLVAHDRASLGGMLMANGVAIWLSAQWGFRAGAA